MNKAEFIKSLEALTKEFKTETQISDDVLLRVFKKGYEEGQEDVFRHLYDDASGGRTFITDVSIDEHIQSGPNIYQFKADVQVEVTIPEDVVDMIREECGFDPKSGMDGYLAYELENYYGIPANQGLLDKIKGEINKK